MTAVIQKAQLGSWQSLLTTELNSLANNTLATLGGAFANAAGNGDSAGNADGYVWCSLEFAYGTPGGSFTAGSGMTLWFVRLGSDGSTYTYSAATPPDAGITIPVPASGTAYRMIVDAWLPIGTWKPLLKNDGTGQSLASSGNTLKVRAQTSQFV